jgi:putative sigma-54 modulation protein
VKSYIKKKGKIMQINITTRHMELEEGLKVYVNDKLERLARYSDKIEEARGVFQKEKFNYITELNLIGKGFHIVAIEKNQDSKASFDLCLTNAQAQLKKARERAKSRKMKRFFRALKPFRKKKRHLLSPQGSIIKTESFAIKPMSPEEAALELEAFKKVFVAFHNAKNNNLNVLYKRKDGHYGLIEP